MDRQAGKERHPVEPILNRESETDALTTLWERSVRATHFFLTEEDIVSLRPAVREGIACVERLFVVRNADGVPEGFMGTTGNKLEMLFVEPESRGRGVGKRLLTHAMQARGVEYADVNEQNPLALGFYEHAGFRVVGRSERDEAGRPFPILHLTCVPKKG